jgi:uncharacterized membrane protein (TIGR02234 family)
MPVMRREFALVLLLGAAGAGLVVLAVRQAWAQAIFTAPRPLPAQDFSVTGQQLVPLAGALALAALACLAAVIGTRSVVRRAFGALLAILGAGTAAAVTTGVRAAAVLSAARGNASNGTLGGSTTSGTSPGNASHPIVIAGSSGHAVMTGVPWRAVAVIGAVAIIVAGLATAWRGQRWSVMSSRFDRPGQQQPGQQQPGQRQPGQRQPGQQRKRTDAATMWESLSRDIDPTVEGTTDPAAPVGAAPDRPAPVGAAPLRAAPVGADPVGADPDRADQFDGGTRT